MLGWTIFTCILFAFAGGLTMTVFFRQGEILKRQKLHTDALLKSMQIQSTFAKTLLAKVEENRKQSLRGMYGRGFTAPQIAKAMGRTVKSVYGMMYRLGLSREQTEKRCRKR